MEKFNENLYMDCNCLMENDFKSKGLIYIYCIQAFFLIFGVKFDM
jgi:hypothetical protein